MKKLTQDEVIERLKNKFPMYGYEKVVYKNNKEKITVTCPIHGDFDVRPDCILNGTGCPSCGGTKKLTTSSFIENANEVHNGFFSYEKTEYVNAGSKVIVTCPIHGDFMIKANNHLLGQGCGKCTQEGIKHEISKREKNSNNTKTYDTETFISKAKEKWGDKYTYEQTKYKKSGIKVTITCPEHGDFEVTPNHFLSGRGCPKCSKNYHYTNEEFINYLKVKFGNKYLYDKIHYKSTHSKILIGCKEHGYFEITPANLLKGKSCPLCSQSKMEEDIMELLDKNNINYIYQFRDVKKFGKLSFDFYIPEKNIIIECQGIQHFYCREFFGGETGFKLQKERDERKIRICKENNYKLLFYANYNFNFPYKVITDKNILLKILLEND